MDLLHDPEIPFLDIYTQGNEGYIYSRKSRKDICALMCIVALFTVANIWKQPMYPSMDEWLKKCYI